MKKSTVTMPHLSDTMETGHLSRWLKQPGDPVKKGEAIAEVESDKALMEIEAFMDGYLAGPLAKADTDIPVGTAIASIVDEPGEVSPSETPNPEPKPETITTELDNTPSAPPAPPTPTASAPSPVVTEALRHHEGGALTQVSELTRQLARELGIDLSAMQGATGKPPSAADILRAALGPAPSTLGPVRKIEKPQPMLRAMAENMAKTAQTPMFHITTAVELTPLQTLAHTQQASFTLLMARACALSIAEHPNINACWTPAGLAIRDRADIGIAVDTPYGLITPVLKKAHRAYNLLAEDWRELKEKLDQRRLLPEDYTGATFYLSNLGIFPEIEQFDAIVPLGAAAILAVAAAGPDDKTRLTLTCDHRVVSGADGARFLTTLTTHLKNPQTLLNG